MQTPQVHASTWARHKKNDCLPECYYCKMGVLPKIPMPSIDKILGRLGLRKLRKLKNQW